MSRKFRVTLPANNENAEQSFEMSKIELEAHWPKQIEMLTNSPCNSIAFPNPQGGVIIEKLNS
ncbi:MAG: hypothetical protein V7K47_20640 [Nostoc sp.]